MYLFASLDPLSIFGPTGLMQVEKQIFAILICSKQLHLPQDPEVTTAMYVEDEGQKGRARRSTYIIQITDSFWHQSFSLNQQMLPSPANYFTWFC